MRRRTILAFAIGALSVGVASVATRRLVRGPGQAAKSASAPPASSRPRSPPPSPTDADLALLSPLRPGELLAGWRVTEIQGIQDGVLGVVVSQDQRSVRLIVALASEDGLVPPASAGQFAVYYSARRTPAGDAISLASALADVLRKNQSVPVPPGLAPFNPPPKPGISL